MEPTLYCRLREGWSVFSKDALSLIPKGKTCLGKSVPHHQDLRKIFSKSAVCSREVNINIVHGKVSMHMTRGIGSGTRHIPKNPPGELRPSLRIHSAPFPPYNERNKVMKLAPLAFIVLPLPLSLLSHFLASNQFVQSSPSTSP